MADQTDAITTFSTFIQTFTDFLTTAIHTILYERNLYPATTFLSAKKYNYSVRQSRHPKVCRWITDAVDAVHSELLKGSVDKVCLVIYSPTAEVVALERVVFDTSRFPVVAKEFHSTPMSAYTADGDDEIVAVLPRVDLEEQMRATMAKLSTCSSRLQRLPDGCSFSLAIELRGGHAQAPLGNPQPWVPVQPDVGMSAGVERAKTTPLRSVAAGDMVFEAWVEEPKAKFVS
jgi:mitotic spindle assembly checkpoint protein MAD2B